MALKKSTKLAALVCAALALPGFASFEAAAQTQLQGQTVGAPPPATPMPAAPAASPAPAAPMPAKPAAPAKPKSAKESAKAKRAECNAQAKEKGLKGSEVKTFVATCVKA